MNSAIRLAPGWQDSRLAWPHSSTWLRTVLGTKIQFRVPPPGSGWARSAILTAFRPPRWRHPPPGQEGGWYPWLGCGSGSRWGTAGIGRLPWRSWSPGGRVKLNRLKTKAQRASLGPSLLASRIYVKFLWSVHIRIGCWAPSSQCRHSVRVAWMARSSRFPKS